MLTAEEQKLSDLIRSESLEAAADAGDFVSLAATLNTRSKTVKAPGPVSMSQTITALIMKGHDPDAVITALSITPTGAVGVSKLAAQGLDFAHPITQALLANRVADASITQDVADTLVAVSQWQVSPADAAGFPDVTATQLSDAWSAFTTEQDAVADQLVVQAFFDAKRPVLQERIDARQYATPADLIADLSNIFTI